MFLIRKKMSPLTAPGLSIRISLLSLLLSSVVLSILFAVETGFFLLIFNDGSRSDFRAIR